MSYDGSDNSIGWPKAVVIASSAEEAVKKLMKWKGAYTKPTHTTGSLWIKRVLEFPICPRLQINEDEQKLACDDLLENECPSLCWLGGIADAFDECPIYAIHEASEGVLRQITIEDETYMVVSWLD